MSECEEIGVLGLHLEVVRHVALLGWQMCFFGIKISILSDSWPQASVERYIDD